ncbi:MAG: hypothetical protein DRO92_02880, partial [Candidatus Altiarchaeales archaeon]
VCREAAMIALREDIKSKKVSREHFEKALKKVSPSISDTDVNAFKNSMERSMKEIAYYR